MSSHLNQPKKRIGRKKDKKEETKFVNMLVHVHVFEFYESCGVRGPSKYFDIPYEYHQMNWQIEEIKSKSKNQKYYRNQLNFI